MENTPNEMGTTSACAENTSEQSAPCRRVGNYLRVRGEYGFALYLSVILLELPPRARRILGRSSMMGHRGGTTSACAENTWK